jgi:hypothetical protein
MTDSDRQTRIGRPAGAGVGAAEKPMMPSPPRVHEHGGGEHSKDLLLSPGIKQ